MPIQTRCPECDFPAVKGSECHECGADVPDDGDMARVVRRALGERSGDEE